MVEKIIKQIEAYNMTEREEDLYLERLKTRAEGVGAIQYGDDASHGTATGDRMENATIKLAEAREKISARRQERFTVKADACDWFYDRLKPRTARVMVMYAVDGLSYRQIADKTGRSVGWVASTVAEAKSTLNKPRGL